MRNHLGCSKEPGPPSAGKFPAFFICFITTILLFELTDATDNDIFVVNTVYDLVDNIIKQVYNVVIGEAHGR